LHLGRTMFLAIFFLLLNSHVRMYVGCMWNIRSGHFAGHPTSPKLRWWDLWWVLGMVLHYVAL
jgi:hypothetical protein